MHILASFCTTRFRALRETWRAYEDLKGSLTAFGTTRQDEINCGGQLVLLDWSTKKSLLPLPLPRAAGLLSLKQGFLVAAYNKLVRTDDSLKIIAEVSDHRFNNIHGLCHMPTGIGVASTGLDTVLFLDHDLRVVDAWYAIDHGFEIDQLGNRRIVNLRDDHREIMYPTLLHTTHVNSLLWVSEASESFLLATFFHQGTVQKIYWSGQTEPVVSGLRAPHSVTQLSGGGFMVADSANNRLVFWVADGNPRYLDLPQCDWIQDAKEMASRGTYLVADCNHCRLLEVDGIGRTVDSWSFDDDWKIQEILPLAYVL